MPTTTAEPPGGRRPDRAAARRARTRPPIPRASASAEELLRAGHRALRRRARTRRRAGRDEAPELVDRLVDDELVASLLARARPAPRRPRGPGRARARVGAAVPRRSTAATSSCSTSTRDVGAVHLRLLGSCDGCPSSAVTLQHGGRAAIIEAAPGDRDDRRRASRSAAVVTTPVDARDEAGVRAVPSRGRAGMTGDPLARAAAGSARRPLPRRSRARASGASCAPSRSPTSTATSSTSSARNLMCTCRGCYLLFTPDGAGGGHFGRSPTGTSRSPSSACRPASGTRCRSR